MPLDEVLYQVVLDYLYKGQTCKNVFWFRSKPTSPHSSRTNEINDMSSNFAAWFTDSYSLFANNQLQFIQHTVKLMSAGEPLQVINNYTLKFGAIGGDGLPPHDAAVISLYTPYHGRSMHGRVYLTGISENDQEGGLLTDAALSRLNTLGAGLITRFAENGSYGTAWGTVFSRKAGVVHNPINPALAIYLVEAANPWTRMVVHRQIRTQRHRRLPY